MLSGWVLRASCSEWVHMCIVLLLAGVGAWAPQSLSSSPNSQGHRVKACLPGQSQVVARGTQQVMPKEHPRVARG